MCSRTDRSSERVPSAPDQEQLDLALMVGDLSEEEQQAFRTFAAAQQTDDLALQVTMPLPLRENPKRSVPLRNRVQDHAGQRGFVRHRLWMARRYAHVREELAFLFGYCWSVLRPMAFELGRRLV